MSRVVYGVKFDDEFSDLDIELFSFREGTAKFGGDPDNRPHHFKNVVRHFWGPKSKAHFQWNPWNELMLAEACENKWLALAGCAASGKSRFAAMWGIVNWLCQPGKTIVLFTSTSLSDSRKRIWGAVEEYFLSASDKNGKPLLPGKLTSSTCKIRTTDGIKIWPDSEAGLFLVPGDRAKLKENIGKLIGIHTARVLFIGDEMPELSPALIEAAKSNLAVNPYFQFIGLGNFAGIYDPFGIFCAPKSGWGGVSPENDRWEIKDGLCLRFDGLKSPNILLGEEKFAGIYSTRHLNEQRVGLGEHTAPFWRMCRSFPCPEADADRIYSQADLLRAKVSETVRWQEKPIRGAALDPAFATGGDKAMMYVGDMGISTDGKQTLQYAERIELREDVRKREESRSLQIAKLFRDRCLALGIPPERAAFDGTGGGQPFGALLAEVWSSKVVSIQFGGAASDRIVGVKDKRPGNKAFTNRVSELWFSGVEYVQSCQIKGLPFEAARDWTERRKETVKGGDGLRMRVETKEEMKARTNGRSPDDGDAACILLALFRERFNFVPTGMEGKRAVIQDSWKKRAQLVNRIYAHVGYEQEAA